MKKTFLAMTISGFLVACSTVSPKASKIQVHTQMSTLLSNCKNLGPVTGAAQFPGQMDDAKNFIREAAADKNGDTVVILNSDHNLYSWTYQGIALRCYEK